MVNPLVLRDNPHLFIKLMEKYNIKPKDIGITPMHKYQIKQGKRKPSLELCKKLVEIVAARSQLGAAARPRGPHGQPQRGRLNFRVRYETGCCPATMAGSGRCCFIVFLGLFKFFWQVSVFFLLRIWL